MLHTQFGSTGLWPPPLSPPTITQWMPSSGTFGIGTEQGLNREKADRTGHLLKVADSPHVLRAFYRHALPGIEASLSLRLVRIWNTWRAAWTITSNTRRRYSSGIFS